MRVVVTDRTKNHLILLAHARAARAHGPRGVGASRRCSASTSRAASRSCSRRCRTTPRTRRPPDQINQAISIIRSRVDKLGVSEPEIRKEAGNQVSIALAGHQGSAAPRPASSARPASSTCSTTRARSSRSSRRARPARPPTARRSTRCSRRPRTGPTRIPTAGATPEQWFAFDAKTHKRMLNSIGQPFPPGASKKQLHEPICKAKAKSAVLLRAPAGTIWADDRGRRRRGGTPTQHRFVMFRHAEATRTWSSSGATCATRSPTTTRRAAPTSRWASRRPAHEGVPGNITQRARRPRPADAEHQEVPFAVILDNKLKTTPTSTSGARRTASAATRRSRALDAARPRTSRSCCSRARCRSVRALSQSQVSATLGKESLRQGLIAGLAGLLVVMI